ncbi:Hydroxysteroid dehydrogenase-like protein 2, partial [Desmophyllum pertusum]
MASALNSENLTLDKESENKSKNINTTCPNVPILTTNTGHPLSLEEIQLNQFVENTEDSSKNDGTPKEAGQQTSSPVDNGVEKMQEERDVAPRRRYGVVEVNDMVTSKRMNARVIRKKFGEGLVSEMPGIFNKKLKLAGKTIFITGASRGIGKAIALKAAKDGANIVIAAKTTEPHPKLPGTIYTAAKEVEEAGGKCRPAQWIFAMKLSSLPSISKDWKELSHLKHKSTIKHEPSLFKGHIRSWADAAYVVLTSYSPSKDGRVSHVTEDVLKGFVGVTELYEPYACSSQGATHAQIIIFPWTLRTRSLLDEMIKANTDPGKRLSSEPRR